MRFVHELTSLSSCNPESSKLNAVAGMVVVVCTDSVCGLREKALSVEFISRRLKVCLQIELSEDATEPKAQMDFERAIWKVK